MEGEIGKKSWINLRTPTPLKEVINYDYANNAEGDIRHSYDRFLYEVIANFKIIRNRKKRG